MLRLLVALVDCDDCDLRVILNSARAEPSRHGRGPAGSVDDERAAGLCGRALVALQREPEAPAVVACEVVEARRGADLGPPRARGDEGWRQSERGRGESRGRADRG
ncbi:hypothetical protein [Nannocystis pusilla]|uniref:hypothetical protein n=1 Tax=Nannocystis pusilla TaxID=889268 RepID=UPI003B8271CC